MTKRMDIEQQAEGHIKQKRLKNQPINNKQKHKTTLKSRTNVNIKLNNQTNKQTTKKKKCK